MACADVEMDIVGDDVDPSEADYTQEPLIRYYQASEIMSDKRGPLHDLLQKQPAVLGSLQVVSGLLSVGVGIIFAATQDIGESFCTLFRVSHLTGILFICAGLVSNFLCKYPKLLQVSLALNLGCIGLAVVAAGLITVDLAFWNPANTHYLHMELLELIVLGLEVFLSAVLCIWFSKEKGSKSG